MPTPDDTAPQKARAGIAVDDWKLPIFRKRLSEAGYTHVEKPFLPGTTLLTVDTTGVITLAQTIKDVEAECQRSKK